MGWALAATQLAVLLLPGVSRPTSVEFQTTVFSRDWAADGTRSLGRTAAGASGSPWCNAGCIPNGSLAAATLKPPTFRAPSLVQLADGTLIAISDERNVSCWFLHRRHSVTPYESYVAMSLIKCVVAGHCHTAAGQGVNGHRSHLGLGSLHDWQH
jgi:hypothetical protein